MQHHHHQGGVALAQIFAGTLAQRPRVLGRALVAQASTLVHVGIKPLNCMCPKGSCRFEPDTSLWLLHCAGSPQPVCVLNLLHHSDALYLIL
jgi:hypothetical protein